MPEVLEPGFDFNPDIIEVDSTIDSWNNPLAGTTYADLIEKTGIGIDYLDIARNWSPARGAIENAQQMVDENTSLEVFLVNHFIEMMQAPADFNQPDC